MYLITTIETASQTMPPTPLVTGILLSAITTVLVLILFFVKRYIIRSDARKDAEDLRIMKTTSDLQSGFKEVRDALLKIDFSMKEQLHHNHVFSKKFEVVEKQIKELYDEFLSQQKKITKLFSKLEINE